MQTFLIEISTVRIGIFIYESTFQLNATEVVKIVRTLVTPLIYIPTFRGVIQLCEVNKLTTVLIRKH